jgi:CBS domain containing-hemolysin-like protein
MPDSEGSSRQIEQNAPESAPRNLPVPVCASAHGGGGEGFFSRLVRMLFGWKAGPTREDLQVVLEAAVLGETGVSATERTMLKNILALRERRIDDVMVPRTDIVAVQQEITLGELIKVFEKAGHSRLVVYNDTLDDPIGMVHIRDLIAFMAGRAIASGETSRRKRPLPAGLDFKGIDLDMTLAAAKIVRELLFVPPSMPALDLLTQMQATHIHLALVVDEYGGTDGLVSMEDIVEQIVGDISDEHDEDELPSVVRQPDGSFVADARAGLEDVTEAIGADFNVDEEAKEVDTIGGYMMAKVGRLPSRGELVPGPPGFEIEVLDADPRRIKRVRIHHSKTRNSNRERDRRREVAGISSPTVALPPPADAAGEDANRNSSDANSAKPPRLP